MAYGFEKFGLPEDFHQKYRISSISVEKIEDAIFCGYNHLGIALLRKIKMLGIRFVMNRLHNLSKE